MQNVSAQSTNNYYVLRDHVADHELFGSYNDQRNEVPQWKFRELRYFLGVGRTKVTKPHFSINDEVKNKSVSERVVARSEYTHTLAMIIKTVTK